jgi:hypothetical protein
MWTDLPLGYVDSTERKKANRKKGKCPKSKFIRICLKENLHREKKD